MRKCDACGYLIFGDHDACNHCGAALVPATVGAAAPAATAASAATAPAASPPTRPGPASGLPAPQPLWTPRAPIAPPPGPVAPAGPVGPPVFDQWRPPVISTPPAKPKRSKGLPALALVVLVAFGAIGYMVKSRGSAVPAGTSAFVAGHGVDYSPADGSYTTSFPEQPVVQSSPVTVGDYSMTISMASVSKNDYEMATASMQLPARVPADRVDELLDDSLKGGIDEANGTLVSKQYITRGGLPAIDAKLKAPDGYSAHVLVLLGGDKLYVLLVHAKTGTDRLYRALDASFVPNVRV